MNNITIQVNNIILMFYLLLLNKYHTLLIRGLFWTLSNIYDGVSSVLLATWGIKKYIELLYYVNRHTGYKVLGKVGRIFYLRVG